MDRRHESLERIHNGTDSVPLVRFSCTNRKAASPLPVVRTEFKTTLSESYLNHVTALLQDTLRHCEEHPVAIAIRTSEELRVQDFFLKADPLTPSDMVSPTDIPPASLKPVSFSPAHRGLVISLSDLAHVLEMHYPDEHSLRSNKIESDLRFYLANRLEFAIHEYGHLVATNGGVICNPDLKNDLKSKRNELFKILLSIPCGFLPDRAAELVPEILSDIRAEVVRRDLVLSPEAPRRIDAFPELGVLERATRGGAMVSPTFSLFGLFRMAAWVPICLANGREDLAYHARKEIFDMCLSAKAPQLLPAVGMAIQYFNLYMSSHRFEEGAFLMRMCARPSPT